MKIPTILKHKPVIISDNYENIDGKSAFHSDAKGLTLGLAQWNDRGKLDISAKVWRYTGEKWSRQSEELPLHRVLDLAILIVRSTQFFQETAQSKNLYNKRKPQIDSIGLQGESMNIAVCTDNELIDEDIQLFRQTLAGEEAIVDERLRTLAKLLSEMGYDGKDQGTQPSE
jgi:hypothetical protein